MSYGIMPGGEQDDDNGQTLPAPPSYAAQPGYGEPGAMPPTYRVWGIIAFICGGLFNLPLGIPTAYMARRYSDQVPPLWAHGDVLAAIATSRKIRAWLIASFVLDVLGIIVVVLAFQGSRSSYDNPSVVAASIKTQAQHLLSDSTSSAYDPGVNVTSVACTRAGTNTDHCVISLSNGGTQTLTVTISGDGSRYSSN
jgi:hypothetical protein